MKNHKKLYSILILLTVLSIFAYLFVWIIPQWSTISVLLGNPARHQQLYNAIGSILSRRSQQLVALILCACFIAISALAFQTMTQNRILTPGILGFDSLYIVIQTTVVYFSSFLGFLIIDRTLNFFVSIILMVGLTLLMYRLILRKNKNNLVLLLLMGMIISTLASNYVSFIQILMNPEEFQTVISITSVTIININTQLIWWSVPALIILISWFLFESATLDVMNLGEVQAKNLGVAYEKKQNLYLILIAVGISISTALIGPLSFLGLIAVNSAKELYKHYQHRRLMIISSMVAIIFLILGQSIVEATGFISTVTMLIQMVGGIYMIILILKERKI